MTWLSGLLVFFLFLSHPSATTPFTTITNSKIINTTDTTTTTTAAAAECETLSLACTTSHPGNKDHCLLDSIKKHRTAFLTNAILIMVVGCLTNLLTLAALPYSWLYYSAGLSTQGTQSARVTRL